MGGVIGGNADGDFVSDDDTDIKPFHFAAEFGGDGSVVF